MKMAVTETIFIIPQFLDWAGFDAAKICSGAENVVKTKPSKHS